MECERYTSNETERSVLYAQDFVEMFENAVQPKEKEYIVNIYHYDLIKAISYIVNT
jgi:hypothetical protein